jgi:hypothetical protein
MTTTPQLRPETKRDEDVIPVNDVPAFGVQIRFMKRVLQDLFAQLRHRNGANGSTNQR